MDNLERKLKAYYENNLDYEHSDELFERLMALEAAPKAAPARRRRYVLPVAAALALAIFGAGWAILHAPRTEEVQTQAPEVSQAMPAPVQNDEDDPVALSKPPAPEEKRSVPQRPQTPAVEAPEPAQQTGQAEAAYREPVEASPEPAPKPLPEDPAPDDTAPVTPAEPSPAEPEDPPPIQPEKPDLPEPEAPAQPADEQPQSDPTPDAPPEADPPENDPAQDEPPIIHLEENEIDASYRMKGARETLILMSRSTGEQVELDVTGWMEDAPLSVPSEEPVSSAVTYTGRSSIADFIFEKTIIYHLKLDDDGNVLVDLDVA